jgi:hypothetical protein
VQEKKKLKKVESDHVYIESAYSVSVEGKIFLNIPQVSKRKFITCGM